MLVESDLLKKLFSNEHYGSIGGVVAELEARLALARNILKGNRGNLVDATLVAGAGQAQGEAACTVATTFLLVHTRQEWPAAMSSPSVALKDVEE